MDMLTTIAVCIVGFLFSITGVVIGGTSLITVPMLIFFGMESRSAVATNMFALIFLSISGAFNYTRKVRIKYRRLVVVFVILTIIGSTIGAFLLRLMDDAVLQRVIGIIMVIMLFTLFVSKKRGLNDEVVMTPWKAIIGSFVVFALGIYGGFFSGGYVTMLTYFLVMFYGYSFLQVVTMTKVLNIFSSIIAVMVFIISGMIDFKIAIPLAISMSAGGYLGVKLSLSSGNLWVRRLFALFVFIMAIKLLFFS